MNIHVLGIGGTFMAGLAILAKQLGQSIAGTDARVYPPMSEQLAVQGIRLHEGYAAAHLSPAPDLVVIGNALSRGNPSIEYVLDHGLPYASGPEWLADHVLQGRHVLAVSGTHGKTTTTALLSWLLEAGGLSPGYLVGGIPVNFGVSARLGQGQCFVVEADEYDTAFFDKRSKFVHYRPRTLIINNIEYDHADIFADLADIRRQFHHLIRTVPASGRIFVPHDSPEVARVLEMGCWTPVSTIGREAGDWQFRPLKQDYTAFEVRPPAGAGHAVEWPLIGRHNAENGTAAIAAACAAGMGLAQCCEAAGRFLGVKRRLEQLGTVKGIRVYDDFAHHPTAIAATLAALRLHVGDARILAVLEPRSNTMKLGAHSDELASSLGHADRVLMFRPGDLSWDLEAAVAALGEKCSIISGIDPIIESAVAWARPGDHVVIMSNGGFGGIHKRMLGALAG